MRRATVGRRYAIPSTVIPERGQFSENGSDVFVSKEIWDVLQEEVFRSNCANNSEEFGEQVSVVVSASVLAGF